MLADTVLGSRSSYDSDHEALRASVRQFLDREIVGHLGEWAAGSIPAKTWERAGEYGFLGFGIAEEFGGVGISDWRYTAVIVDEAMRVGATAVAMAIARHAAAVSVLSEGGDVGAKWLPALASGSARLAVVGLDEPLAGVDGGSVVDGAAAAVLSGAVADLYLVVLDVDGDKSLVAVEAGLPGVERFESAGLLGVRAAGVAGVRFAGASGVVVSSEASTLARLRSEEAIGLALAASAGARSALEIAVDYVKSRKVFGRPLASFENTRYALAEVAVRIASARALLDACLLERDTNVLEPARAAVAALAATEAHVTAVDSALQLHGGYGYMREYPIAQAFADARFLRLLVTGSGTPYDAIADALAL